MAIDLRDDIFAPVLTRMKERKDSLRNIKRFPRTGIEGWFKVEIVAVLGPKVHTLQNKGPDLLLEDGTTVELKAATNFDKAYLTAPIRKYHTPVLFLGNGTGQTRLVAGGDDDFEVVGSEVFSDGKGEWIIGLLKPKALHARMPIARQSKGRERTKGGVSGGAVGALKKAYRRFRSHELVSWRIRTCVEPLVQIPTRAGVWRGMALALCTSKQKSGPGTRVDDLWNADSCPLSLDRVKSWYPQVDKKVAAILQKWGGVRFYNKIGKYVAKNYGALYKDGLIYKMDRLVHLLYELRQLPSEWNEDARRAERGLCNQVLDLKLAGIGNKQCRNWLQAVGLLRYEVPLDSRVQKFLEPFAPPGRLDYDRFGDREYYEAAEDFVQVVCRQAGLLPCVGDIVMFLSAGEK